MSSPPPSRSNNYTAGTDTQLTDETWNAVLNDIAARLTAAEAIRANFQALINTGVGQALELISEDVAPIISSIASQVASLDSDITLLNSQFATIIAGEIPASIVVESDARVFATSEQIAQIATNEGNIVTNTADIVTNTADIVTNTAAIVTNTAAIVTNTNAIAVLEAVPGFSPGRIQFMTA